MRASAERDVSGLWCIGCRLGPATCMCPLMPKLALKTRVAVIMHYNEYRRSSNTGRLALRCLTNSQLLIRGAKDRPLDASSLLHGNPQRFVLYPSEKSIPLSRDIIASDRPVTLVVPDGNWGQAKRSVRRVPELSQSIHVTLPPGPVSNYRLRKNIKPDRVATLEAIARALGILESPSVQTALESVLDVMVKRMLATRRRRAH